MDGRGKQCLAGSTLGLDSTSLRLPFSLYTRPALGSTSEMVGAALIFPVARFYVQSRPCCGAQLFAESAVEAAVAVLLSAGEHCWAELRPLSGCPVRTCVALCRVLPSSSRCREMGFPRWPLQSGVPPTSATRAEHFCTAGGNATCDRDEPCYELWCVACVK